jgi:hypothetical protein
MPTLDEIAAKRKAKRAALKAERAALEAESAPVKKPSEAPKRESVRSSLRNRGSRIDAAVDAALGRQREGQSTDSNN